MHEILKIAKHFAIEPDVLRSLCKIKVEDMALSFQSQRHLNNTRSVLIRDNVAIIPIHGPITARSDLFTFFLGGTSLCDLAKDFQTVLDDDQIKAILFDVDSPGGVAHGPLEMAQAIFNARAKKPIWSYVGRNCSSAAYWLASATEKIIAHPSAHLGSIGVVTTMQVQEKPDLDGYKNIEIVSSNAKHKRPDPKTEDGITQIRSELDDLEAQFIESVARFRSTSVETVKKDFGQGGVLIGKNAVLAGMADDLGTFEETLFKLNSQFHAININNTKNHMNTNKETIERSAITADFIKSEFPEIVKTLNQEVITKAKEESFLEGKQAGIIEGKKAENQRILAIEETALMGHEDLVKNAKADIDMDAQKLALQIISKEKQRGTNYLQSLKKSEEELPKISPNFSKEEAKKEQSLENLPLEERVKSKWQNDPKLRAEFADDYDAYLAFEQAASNNQIKILSR